MTESEAIKELHEIRPRGGIIPQKRAEAIDMAIKALEKQVPKKPILKHDISGKVLVTIFTYLWQMARKKTSMIFVLTAQRR